MSNWHPDIPEEYRNKIVTGDALLLLETLPKESIGLIITSPPYNVGLNYLGYEDNLPEDDFREFNKKWLTSAFRALKDDGRLYAIISDKMLYWFKSLAETIGWKYAMKLTWCKSNLGGGKRIIEDWHFMTEDILLFRKGKRSSMLMDQRSNCFNWIIQSTPQSNFKEGRIHPAQMPLGLIGKLLCRTPGKPILDPFAGSGSVLVSAKKEGRLFIGFELIPEVSDMANKRLFETNPPLFPRLQSNQKELL